MPATAIQYREQGKPWVVIGDENYGEGSSREHAALEPRFLGGCAVIARSFARIHQTNLRKQGMLAFEFANPADYDKVRSDDLVDIIGVTELAEGSKVSLVCKHKDGSKDELPLTHTMNDNQISWFKHGSALNKMAAAAKSA